MGKKDFKLARVVEEPGGESGGKATAEQRGRGKVA